MDDGKGENVMSVELAIQRELAYRQKLASMQSRSDNSMDNLKPLRVPPANSSKRPSPRPNPSAFSGPSMSLVPASYHQVQASSSPRPTLTGNQYPSLRPGPNSISNPIQALVPHMPTPTPIQTLMPLPARSQIPNPSSLPRPASSQITCPRPLARPIPSQVPISRSLARPNLIPMPSFSGIKRKGTSSSNLQCQPPQQPRSSHNINIIVHSEGNFFCKVCQVACTCATSLKHHFKGHKHKEKLQGLKMSNRDGGWKEDTLGCEICQIWCTDEDSLEMHLKGKSHQAKVQKLEFGRKTGGELVAQQPWCELCQIWCMNEESLQQHLKGKKHVIHLDAIEREKRAVGEGAAVLSLEWKRVI